MYDAMLTAICILIRINDIIFYVFAAGRGRVWKWQSQLRSPTAVAGRPAMWSQNCLPTVNVAALAMATSIVSKFTAFTEYLHIFNSGINWKFYACLAAWTLTRCPTLQLHRNICVLHAHTIADYTKAEYTYTQIHTGYGTNIFERWINLQHVRNN